MLMKHFKKISFLFFLNLISSVWATIGIGTKFATVVVEKLEPGGIYNITQLRNIPLKVINSGDLETEAGVDVEIPSAGELKEGYEPIPDPSWIKILPARFHLKAGAEIACELIISIPNDQSLVGGHFQAKIWSHSIGEDLFGAGVVNRVFFSVGTGPEGSKAAKKKKLLYPINFDVSPDTIYLTVPIGEKVDVLKEFDQAIKLINKGKGKITVNISSVGKPETLLVTPDYEFTPNIEFLKIEPKNVTVKGNSIKDAQIFMEIPAGEKYKSKRYLFLVKVTITKPEVPIEFYVKILVTTN